MSGDFGELKQEAAGLLLDWALMLEEYYGEAGSMDYDRLQFPDGDGPSYYMQMAHYSYLLLSEGIVPGASDEQKERFRDVALRNIEYVVGLYYDDFRTPHYSRGVDWGAHYGEWLNYYLRRSLEIMEERGIGTQELRDEMRRCNFGAISKIYDIYQAQFGPDSGRKQEFTGNHSTWYALMLYEAGQYYGKPEWMEFADYFFATYVVPTQLPCGVWPEGQGIVVNYSRVTAQSTSLYAEASQDEATLCALDKALTFFDYFSFRDGSAAVVADCRQRYHGVPMVFMPVSFLRSEKGRQMILNGLKGMHGLMNAGKLTPDDATAQGLAFYGTCPHFMYSEDIENMAAREPVEISDLPTAKLQAGNWTGFVSWQVVPEHPSRFIIDSQNFIELYHDEAGYLIGGGNSKYMPRFSTVRRVTRGRSYIPENARLVEADETHAVVVYEFGDDAIEVKYEMDEGSARISFALVACDCPDDVYEGAVFLYLRPGEVITVGGDDITVETHKFIDKTFTDEMNTLTWRGRTFTMPAGAHTAYPLVPHNPYRQDGLPEPSQYVMRLEMKLSAEVQTIVIE